jgi:hypothetical protein
MGNNAKANMQRTGNYEGQGMATAAIILGWIGIALWALAVAGRVMRRSF